MLSRASRARGCANVGMCVCVRTRMCVVCACVTNMCCSHCSDIAARETGRVENSKLSALQETLLAIRREKTGALVVLAPLQT